MDLNDQQPLLSLCMIVKNEADNLPNCLSGIKSIVDEMIVVDTGSTDGTVQIAKGQGAAVYPFQWIDDFSAARNDSIRHASGAYIIWLDADDRIAPEDQVRLKNLKDRLAPQKNAAYMLKLVCRKSDGEVSVSDQLRIFPNLKTARFEGVVHEQIIPSLNRLGVRIVADDTQIIHTGYINDQAIHEKAARNLKILLSTKPTAERTPSEWYLLGQSYFGVKDYRNCLDCLEKARLSGQGQDYCEFSYSMTADSYLQLGLGEKAVRNLRKALKEFPTSKLLHYHIGAALVRLERYPEALLELETALHLPMKTTGYPTPADIDSRIRYYYGRCFEGIGRLEKAVEIYTDSLGSYPRDIRLLKALGFSLVKTGKVEKGLYFLEILKEMSLVVEKDLWHAMAKIHLFLKNHEKARCLYQQILDIHPSDPDAIDGIAKIENGVSFSSSIQ